MPAVTNVSSSTSVAFAKPASTSPYDHSTSGSPIGSWPSPARAKSPAVHSTCFSCGGPIKRLSTALPSVRASGPPGNRLCSGSTVNGSSSKSILIRSIASCAIVSVSAATARIGLADPHRLVGQDRLGRRRQRRHVGGRQNAEHAGQRERRARVDVAHARMRHRAQQELAEHHAFGAEILRVLGLAGDFAVHVGRHEVLSQQVVSHRANSLINCPPNLVVRRLVDFKPKRHPRQPDHNNTRFPPQQRFFEEIPHGPQEGPLGQDRARRFRRRHRLGDAEPPRQAQRDEPEAQRRDARHRRGARDRRALRRLRADGRRRLVRGRHGSSRSTSARPTASPT